MRTAHQHHVSLSSMADQKANILTGTSFLMLTLLFGQMSSAEIQLGQIVLAVFTAAAALFALLAVIPRFRRPKGVPLNPLFFGHFSELTEEEFVNRLRRELSDDDRLYDLWMRDLFQLGRSLYKRKYRFLRLSYQLLLTGFFAATVITLIQGYMPARPDGNPPPTRSLTR